MNKYQEAKKWIEHFDNSWTRVGINWDAVDEITFLLRKETPKKPISIGDEYSSILSCFNCKEPIINVWNRKDYEPNYCHFCGQSIDWSKHE